MNTPITFELAKCLKKKGFDEKSLSIYQDGELMMLKSTISNSEFMTSRNYTASTIAEVIMWLYEKHGTWVYSYHNGTSFIGSIQDITGSIKGRLFAGYTTPTEAYLAAIEYTLKNIIK